ncbi:MAG: ABC transporter substrate-binding protein [Acetobacteraceae bacterium]|nr:ABC transporter substrate-binding protein [Acetobacteraceae bacterium]
MMVGRRPFALGLAACALPLVSARAADPDAVAPIQALDQALLAAMKAGKQTPFAQRYAALAPAVERAFDLPAILRASVGLRWSSLTPADQQRLLEVFRKFTVTSYVANFDKYSGERIEVVPETRKVGADQIVGTRIVSGSDTTPIDYVMHKGADGWRATDVLLNGSISQVAVNRSDWRALLASGAGPLIDSLQRRVAALSGGAIT